MRKELPARPNLEHLKSQAKDLLDALRRKEPGAIQRFRESLPAARGAGDEAIAAMELALHDAQSVIAREYGFASFADLRAHVEAQAMTAEAVRELMSRNMSSPLPSEVQQALLSAMSADRAKEAPAPSPLPLVPLRAALLSVGAVAPLSIGRAASVAAVLAAQEGGGVIAVITQKDDANEAPGEGDLHPVGCAARLLSVIQTKDRGLWIVVRAIEWVRLEAIDAGGPCLMARVAPFEVQGEETGEVKELERALRARVRAAAEKLPGAAHLLQMTEGMSARELADIAIANLPCAIEEKARYAVEPSLVARLTRVIALFDRAA
jgi:Lon protease-like protein